MAATLKAGLPTRLQLAVLVADIAIGCLISIFVLDVDLARSTHPPPASLSSLVSLVTPDLGAPRVMALICLPLALILILRWHEQNGRRALFLLGTIAIAYLMCLILKVAFGRSRPELLYAMDVHVFAFGRWAPEFHSFPSANAAVAMGLALAGSDLRDWQRHLILPAGLFVAIMPVLTGLHFLSDVFFGLGIGVIGWALCKTILAAYHIDPFADGRTRFRGRR